LITFAAVGLTQDQRGINRKSVRYSMHVTRLLRMPVSWLLSTPQGTPTPTLWTCCIYYTSDNSKTSSFLFYYVKEYLESRILTSQGTTLKYDVGSNKVEIRVFTVLWQRNDGLIKLKESGGRNTKPRRRHERSLEAYNGQDSSGL